MQPISQWIKQPSTILGLGSIAATAASLIAHVLTHDTTATVAAGSLAFSAVSILMPDNTAAPSAVEKLVVDGVTAAVQKHLLQSVPTLMADAMAIVTTLQPVTVTTVPPPVPTPIGTPVPSFTPVAVPATPVLVEPVTNAPVTVVGVTPPTNQV